MYTYSNRVEFHIFLLGRYSILIYWFTINNTLNVGVTAVTAIFCQYLLNRTFVIFESIQKNIYVSVKWDIKKN